MYSLAPPAIRASLIGASSQSHQTSVGPHPATLSPTPQPAACIASKIRSLLTSLPQGPPEYDRIAPDIEFWIEYVLREQFITVDELVESVSWAVLDESNYASVARFLEEFRDVHLIVLSEQDPSWTSCANTSSAGS